MYKFTAQAEVLEREIAISLTLAARFRRCAEACVAEIHRQKYLQDAFAWAGEARRLNALARQERAYA